MSGITSGFSVYISEQTEDFTGHEWVFNEIKACLADPVIEGWDMEKQEWQGENLS